MVFEHVRTDFLEAQEQYLVVIASCLPKKINPQKEPILAQVCRKYPQADIYNKSKRIPGSYQIVGEVEGKLSGGDKRSGNDKSNERLDQKKGRPIILIFSQFYDGKADFPNDNKQKRLTWFQEALDDISEIRGLQSLAFPTQIARDGGGNWSQYYTAIKDFTQTLELKIPLTVKIYENPYGESMQNPSVQTKISLLNCLNLMENVNLEQMYLAKGEIQVVPEKPSLDQRESLTSGIKRTKMRLNKKVLEKQNQKEDPKFDVISSSSEGPMENNNKKSSPTRKKTSSPPRLGTQTLQLSDSSENPQELVDDEELVSNKMEEWDEQAELGDDVVEGGELGDMDEFTEELAEDDVVPQFPSTKKNSDWGDQLYANCFMQIHPSWREIFERPEIQNLLKIADKKLTTELKKYGDTIRFRPDYDHIFHAFNLCPLEELKVVILGQDPYFSNINEAMGLSFSVPEGVPVPPSLRNIFKEIKQTYSDYEMPKHGDLTDWGEQGVLLLNSSLTVRHGTKESHMAIWKSLTDKLIEIISRKAEHPLVFLLWGRYAQSKEKLIDCRKKKHLILKATHPSPLGASRGGWFGCRHFDKANERLMSLGLDPIDWQT